MWIKICANTSVADAQLAIDLGADAVGFIFAPSARRVTLEEVQAITARLTGDAERIGVFQNLSFEEVCSTARVAGLTGIQLHGGYSPELVHRLRTQFGDELTIVQTLHWVVGEDGAAERLAETLRKIRAAGHVDRVLVDSQVGAALGGTGRSFDWKAAQRLFTVSEDFPMIVAGGLDAENVGEAIGRLGPWGVDVASGVESSPGRKNPERLRLFIERARAADGSKSAS